MHAHPWRLIAACLLLACASACSSPVRRREPPPVAERAPAAEAEDDGWRTTVTPYLWLLSLDGDITVRGAKAQVDAKTLDLLGNLDYYGQIHLETRKDEWGFYVDPSFFALSDDGNLGPISLDADVDLGLYELGFVRRLASWQTEGGPPAELDLLAGLRQFDLGVKLKLSSAGPLGLGTRVSGDEIWTDAVVGVRYRRPLSEDAHALLRVDVGGFGFGSSSTFSWNLVAMLSHELDEGERLWYGYRMMGVDYSDGSGPNRFALDAEIAGLILGWQIPF